MSHLSDYIAAKDAERGDGSVDWSKVPERNGGTQNARRESDNPQMDHLLNNLND